MAQNPVTNRATLTSYCKRKLGEDGSSMIDVNVTDDQADDVIDDAWQYFRDYHIDATQRTFIKHQVTSTEITNQYLTFTESEDDTVMGVVNVYPIGGSSSTTNMFNINYQLHANDIWGLLDIEFDGVFSNLSFPVNVVVKKKDHERVQLIFGGRHAQRAGRTAFPFISRDRRGGIRLPNLFSRQIHQSGRFSNHGGHGRRVGNAIPETACYEDQDNHIDRGSGQRESRIHTYCSYTNRSPDF